jgi:quercetin dioxygenase-like cupin family protein
MKKYKSKEYEKDCRICGYYNEAPLNIARAVTRQVLDEEKIHYHENDFEYYIFIRGKGKVLIGEQEWQYETGDVFLIEPMEKHKMVEILEETDYITVRSNVNPGNKVVVE